jgi:hypothetical protein
MNVCWVTSKFISLFAVQIFQYYAEVCDEHGVPFESRTTDQHALW